MSDDTRLHWNAPKRRATQPMGGSEDYDAHPTQRPSTTAATNYFGLDGSESSSSASAGAGLGGFTQLPARSSGGGGHSRPGSAASPAAEIPVERDRRMKVNQIVQNFFWKAAMVIIQSRMPVVAMLSPKTHEKKTNKWACPPPPSCCLRFAASANGTQFNIELDEMETFRDELRSWRLGDSFEPRPQPLIIETYLDTSELTNTQALVILDASEKRWNVIEAFRDAANRAGLNVAPKRGDRATAAPQIVLERWKVELRLVLHPAGVGGAPERERGKEGAREREGRREREAEKKKEGERERQRERGKERGGGREREGRREREAEKEREGEREGRE